MTIEKNQELSDFIHEAQSIHHDRESLLNELIERQESRLDHFSRQLASKFEDLYKSDSYFIPLELRKNSYIIAIRNLKKERFNFTYLPTLKVKGYTDGSIVVFDNYDSDTTQTLDYVGEDNIDGLITAIHNKYQINENIKSINNLIKL